MSTDNGEETVEVIADNGEKQRKKRHFLHLMTDQAVLRKSILIFWTVRAGKQHFCYRTADRGEYKKTIKREIREGHEIGIHTYTHEADEIYCKL